MKKLLLVLLLASPVYAAENLSQLISDARVLSLDPSGSRQRFTDTQITQFLNVGQRMTSSQSRCFQQSLTFQLAVGTTFYPLPTNYYSTVRVTVGSKWIQEMSPAAVDARSRSWETVTGYPVYYFTNFSSRALIGFTPVPASGADTDTVKVEFNVQPGDMVNSGDFPFNGITELQDYHPLLAYYAAAIMETVSGLGEQAASFFSVYQAGIKSMADRCLERPNYRPGMTGAQ